MPFVYRLQKILDFRIRKKEEQLLVVLQAQQALRQAELMIEENNREIEETKVNQKKANALMYGSYDTYLHHLWNKAEELEEVRLQKEVILKHEMKVLTELEQAVKVLEKHRERNREAYIQEEKKQELKTYSEIGVQRFYQQEQQKKDEEFLQEMEKLQEEIPDEY